MAERSNRLRANVSQAAAMALFISAMLISPITAPAVADNRTSSLTSSLNENGADNFQVSFVEVAARAGLREPIVYGGIERKRYIIETNGCGVAFLDYDNDGWMDILLLNGTRLEGFPAGRAPTLKLYHNNRNGTFSDVSNGSGLTGTGWASAVTIGDYDNDGNDDLFITYYGQNILYHNDGRGRFSDVTAKAGLATKGTRWGSGCAFVDYDRDGRLDLFVANYLLFDPASVPDPGKGPNCLWKGVPVNCGPKGLPSDTNLLYHNNGDGTFTDVSQASGISKVQNRYAMTAIVTDYDNDGWPDLYVACDSTASILYRNLGNGRFKEVTSECGPGAQEMHSSRGCAFGDYDNDGDIDVLIMNMNEPPSLLRNDYNGGARGANNWLTLKLIGTKSNRSAIGARV
ncbi:MAG TPA: VCBS repeat-containing protein, partial [Blastocatellia bacterium]